jgi:hypothetical protein
LTRTRSSTRSALTSKKGSARWPLPAGRSRAVGRLSTVAVGIALLAGCGGSNSSGSLSGPRHVPKGYSVDSGQGYSIIFPTGWRQTPYRTDVTHSGTTFVPPGSTPVDATYPFIETELSAPRSSFPPQQDFASFIGNLRDETTTTLPSGARLADTVTVAAAKVPGASETKRVTVLGPGASHETDLIVLAPVGVIKLTVAWYPAHEPLDPNAVIDSFRLNR